GPRPRRAAAPRPGGQGARQPPAGQQLRGVAAGRGAGPAGGGRVGDPAAAVGRTVRPGARGPGVLRGRPPRRVAAPAGAHPVRRRDLPGVAGPGAGAVGAAGRHVDHHRQPGVDHPGRGVRHARRRHPGRGRRHAGEPGRPRGPAGGGGDPRTGAGRADPGAVRGEQGRADGPGDPGGGLMRFWVDSWDPAYAAENGPVAAEPATVAGTDPEVEVPAAVWTPMPYPADLRPPRTVLLVDGVRRDDARLWTAEPDGSSLPALAASYAAGVVRCDLWEGRAALAGEPVVERGLFTPSRTLTDLECAGLRYRVHRVATEDPAGLPARVQALLTRLEATVAAGARAGAEAPTELLVLDGPLRGRSLPRTIGYVKTHQPP